MKILGSWISLSLAVAITAYLLPGVTIAGFVAVVITALVLGIINVTIKPLLHLLSLPITLLTLGLFSLVINALLILLVARFVPGFEVMSFWWAVAFGFVVSVINSFLSKIFK